MVITSIVMDVMHFITISCNLKIDALHFTHHYLKKCNDCNVLPLHITIKQYTLPLPRFVVIARSWQTNQSMFVCAVNLIAIYNLFKIKKLCVLVN